MKINRTDEQWKALLIRRAETLHKLTTLIAPCAVMEGALWSVYDAIHKGSTRSKIRSMRHRLWVLSLIHI